MHFENLQARQYQLVARIVSLSLILIFNLGILISWLIGFLYPSIFLIVLVMICIFFIEPFTKDPDSELVVREVTRLAEYLFCSFYAFSLAVAGLVAAFSLWPGRLYWAVSLMIVVMLSLGAIQMWKEYFHTWERMVIEFGVPLVLLVIGREPVGGIGWEIAVYCGLFAGVKFMFVDLLLHRSNNKRTLFTASMHGLVAGGWLVFSLAILVFLIPIISQVFFS